MSLVVDRRTRYKEHRLNVMIGFSDAGQICEPLLNSLPEIQQEYSHSCSKSNRKRQVDVQVGDAAGSTFETTRFNMVRDLVHSSMRFCPLPVPIEALSISDTSTRLYIHTAQDLLDCSFHFLSVGGDRNLRTLVHHRRHMSCA